MDEDRQGMHFGVLEGVSASIMSAITATYLTVFALALGANAVEIGLIVALPATLAVLSYLPAAFFVERSVHRNRICAVTALLGRSSWLIAAVVPVFFSGSGVFWLMVVACIAALFETFTGPSWASLMGDIVPEHHRGEYFGRRNTFCKIASLVTVFAAGFVLDIFSGMGGFTIIFAAAGFFGILTAAFFSRFPEFKYRARERLHAAAAAKDMLSNRMFRRLVAIAFIWQVGVSLSSPFMNVYIVEELGAAYFWISILSLTSGLAGIAVQRGWGNLSDRFSHRAVIIVGSLGAAFIPLFYIFSTSPAHIIPINILSGISWAGVDIAVFNYLLQVSRGKKRALYSAFYWSAINAALVVGPMIGGLMLDSLPSGAFGLSNYGFMFFSSWIVRLAGALLFTAFLLEIPEKAKYSMKHVTSEMVIVGFSHAMRSFHLMKEETESIPSRIFVGFGWLFRTLAGLLLDALRRALSRPQS